MGFFCHIIMFFLGAVAGAVGLVAGLIWLLGKLGNKFEKQAHVSRYPEVGNKQFEPDPVKPTTTPAPPLVFLKGSVTVGPTSTNNLAVPKDKDSPTAAPAVSKGTVHTSASDAAIASRRHSTNLKNLSTSEFPPLVPKKSVGSHLDGPRKVPNLIMPKESILKVKIFFLNHENNLKILFIHSLFSS
jgi:hypothetical protein